MNLVEWQPVSGCSPISPGCANCRLWDERFGFNEDQIDLTLSLDPAHILVCSRGDLFHDAISDLWLDKIFERIRATPQHVYRIVTKRSQRMKDYMIAQGQIRNVWLGASAERQQEADFRFPLLAATPAAVRYVTLYPLLGAIDLTRFLPWIKCVQVGEEPERPMKPEWLKQIIEDCAASGVPLVFDTMVP